MYPLLKQVAIPVQAEDVETEMRMALYGEAATKLNYYHPTAVRRLHGVDQQVLARTLKRLSIKMFTPASVQRYKKFMQKPVKRKEMNYIGLSLLSLGLGIFSLSFHRWMAAMVADAGFLFFMLSTIIMAIMAIKQPTLRGIWLTHTMGDYDKRIPDSIVALALLIHGELPRARFHVEELSVTVEPRKVVYPDPFFRVSLEKEEFYIGQWDEDDYVPEYLP